MANDDQNTFHWADYLILALFLVFSAGIGVVVGFLNRKKNVDAKDFLTGGGDMHFIPVGLSLGVNFMSAIFVISIPAELYVFGTTYAFLSIAYLVGFSFAGHVYLPVMHRLGITSGYQYLELRFSKAVRLCGAVTFSIMTFLYNGVVVYTPAVALSQASGIETYVSILLIGGVVTFYTALGGLKATIWNDALQVIIIFLNFVLIIIFGSLDKDVGGLGTALQKAVDGGLNKMYEAEIYNPDPFIRTTFWSQVVGGSVLNVVLFSSSQSVIQKFISVKSISKAKISVWIAAAMNSFFLVLVFFIGCIIYAKYENCDPLESGQVDKIDQIMSLFVLDIMGNLHGLPGLFLAAAFSATLSTVAGGLNAMAPVYLSDFIAPAYQHFTGIILQPKTATMVTRCLAVLFGLLTVGMAFLSEVLGDVAIQISLSIFGMVGGPLCGVLSLGMFVPCANAWGALSGLIVSLGLTMWIGIAPIVEGVPNVPHLKNNTCSLELSTTISPIGVTTEAPEFLKIYELAYSYYGLFAILLVFIVGITVSLITGGNKDPEKLDPRLYYFFQEEVGCCCPYTCRTGCRCDVPLKDDDMVEEISIAAKDGKVTPEGIEIGFKNEMKNQEPYTTSDTEKHLISNGLSNGYPSYDNSAFSKDENITEEEPYDPLYERLHFRQDQNPTYLDLEQPTEHDVISTEL